MKSVLGLVALLGVSFMASAQQAPAASQGFAVNQQEFGRATARMHGGVALVNQACGFQTAAQAGAAKQQVQQQLGVQYQLGAAQFEQAFNEGAQQMQAQLAQQDATRRAQMCQHVRSMQQMAATPSR